MEKINVLVIPQVSDEVLQRVQNVDRRLSIIDARGWFDGELRATWPQWTVNRYLSSRKYPSTSLEERNRALALAEVVLMGWPPLKDLRARAPRLKWLHELPADEQFSGYRSLGRRYLGDNLPRANEQTAYRPNMCWLAFFTLPAVCT